MDFWNLNNGFMPHGVCLRWDTPLLVVFIAGNLGIAIAYFIIPAALRHFVGKRADLPYPHMFKLFAAFILSCGITHLIKIWTLFQPQYWLEATVDLWTAAVSLLTAALLWPLIPKALALRSPEELEKANAQLKEEIAARVRSEKQLLDARDQAIEASNVKSAFIANVSHELRTPLVGVLGMNELLMGMDLSPEQHNLAKEVDDSGRSLLHLVNDLLDLSRIEAGKLTIDCLPFNFSDTLREASSVVETTAHAKGLTLEVVPDEKLPKIVFGDRMRTLQVLVNLLGNAVKFTPSGSVRLTAKMDAETEDSYPIRVEVTDTGIGISENERTLLFKPFSQVDSSSTRKYGGTGLGLSISKRIVELMGGETGMRSEKGVGSTFWFRVPYAKRGDQAGAAGQTITVRAAAAPVLVIEDHPTVQALVARQLSLLHIPSTVVGTAEEGLSALDAQSFALILLDVHLPAMDGYEATRVIRAAEDSAKHIPIIAMTAGALQGDREKCLAAGMDDYLPKPYTFDQLKEKLAQWLPVKDEGAAQT